MLLPAALHGSAHPVASTSFGSEVKLTTRLGAPLALGELGWMSTYIVDAIMVGRMEHSALAIAASSLGNSIFYAILFCAVGMLYGLDTLVSQAFGRDDLEDGCYSLAQSLFLVAAFTPAVMLLTWFSPLVLTRLHLDPAMVSGTRSYLHAIIWSTAPLLLYMAVRRYLQAIDRPGWITVSLLTANLVNLFGDWVLIYGHFGFRAMGIAGSGWATCVVRVYMLGLLVISLWLSLRRSPIRPRTGFFRPRWSRILGLLKLGWPIGLQSLAELSVSTFFAVLAGKLGATLLAAHQVVLDLNAFVAMIPLGLSAAVAVRTGQGMGRSDTTQVRRTGNAGMLIVGLTIAVAATSFLLVPRMWAHIYTNDLKVVAATVPIFAIAAASQLFDGVQVILAGALRGMGKTRAPMFASVGWYWLLGVPLGYVLCFRMHLLLRGLWMGSFFAICPIALTLLTVWRHNLKKLEGPAPARVSGVPLAVPPAVPS